MGTARRDSGLAAVAMHRALVPSARVARCPRRSARARGQPRRMSQDLRTRRTALPGRCSLRYPLPAL